jgi:hypothetical protein
MTFAEEADGSKNLNKVFFVLFIKKIRTDLRLFLLVMQKKAKSTHPILQSSIYLFFLNHLSSNEDFRENISRKLFAKTFREKVTKFRENRDTFRNSFRFREKLK